jgi:hypothetical protein
MVHSNILFFVVIILFHTVFPGICLGRDIPTINGGEFNTTLTKICAKYFSVLLEKERKEILCVFCVLTV